MIQQLSNLIIRAQQRSVGLALLLLSAANVALVAGLLYVLLPKYDTTFNEARALSKVQLAGAAVQADVANLWAVRVSENSRRYVGSYIRQAADKPIVDRFVRDASSQTFSRTISSTAAMALINGNSACERVLGVPAGSPATQRFRTELGTKVTCWVPIMSSNNSLIGYVVFIFKEMLSDDEMAEVITRATSIIGGKL